MCEANVYIRNCQEEESLLMESVDKVIPQGEDILLESIFGHRKIVKGKIVEMALLDHKIILMRD